MRFHCSYCVYGCWTMSCIHISLSVQYSKNNRRFSVLCCQRMRRLASHCQPSASHCLYVSALPLSAAITNDECRLQLQLRQLISCRCLNQDRHSAHATSYISWRMSRCLASRLSLFLCDAYLQLVLEIVNPLLGRRLIRRSQWLHWVDFLTLHDKASAPDAGQVSLQVI